MSALSAAAPAGAPPRTSGVICCGLGCVDLQLVGATLRDDKVEAINTFDRAVYAPGGSVPNTALALARLGVAAAAVTPVGRDDFAAQLTEPMRAAGVDVAGVVVDPAAGTSLAVLPIFPNGGRGCWVNLAANDGLTAAACLSAVDASYRRGGLYKTVHVGYPHLMAKLRGAELRALLEGARELLGPGTTTSVDLNGVSADTHSPEVLGPALSCIDVLHCNEDEAPLVSGVKDGGGGGGGGGGGDGDDDGDGDSDSDDGLGTLRAQAAALHAAGVALVAITLGAEGAYVSVTPDYARLDACAFGARLRGWRACRHAAYAPAPGAALNANGAGDTFVAGLLAGLCDETVDDLEVLTQVALAAALCRVDGSKEERPLAELLEAVRARGGEVGDLFGGGDDEG